MAIEIYTGPVGSGKSFNALRRGLLKIRAIPDRYVIANFPITISPRPKLAKKESARWHFWDEITPEKLLAFSIEKGFYGKEGSCLLIIDEAGVMFNTRDWQTAAKDRKNWINFLSLSRKCGYDVILIAQMDRMIDKQIRGLAEYEVRHFNARNYWWLKWVPLKLHFSVTFWYHTKFKGKVEPFIISKRIARKYDTMRLFNLDGLTEQIQKMYSGSVIPAPVVKFLDEQRKTRELEKLENNDVVIEGVV